jgi:hypothetical protein
VAASGEGRSSTWTARGWARPWGGGGEAAGSGRSRDVEFIEWTPNEERNETYSAFYDFFFWNDD